MNRRNSSVSESWSFQKLETSAFHSVQALLRATGSRDFTEATHNHNASRRVATWFTCITMFHGSHAELFSLLFTLFTSALHSVQELLQATGSRDFIGATHNHDSKARPQEEWLHGSHVPPCPMVHMRNFSVFSSLCSLQHSTLFKHYFGNWEQGLHRSNPQPWQ